MTTPNPEAQQPIETITQPNNYREHDLDEARIVDFMQEDGTIGRGVVGARVSRSGRTIRTWSARPSPAGWSPGP